MKKKNKSAEMSEQEKKIACAKKTSIGGQALMEGIMMRGPKKSAMAVRNPQGEIVLEITDISSGKRPFITKIPIARGVYNFAVSMIIGYKALMRSAEISGLEELEEEMAKEKAAKKAAKKASKEAAKNGQEPKEESASAEEITDESDSATIENAEESTTVAKESTENLESEVTIEADIQETISKESAQEAMESTEESVKEEAEEASSAEEPSAKEVSEEKSKPEKKKKSALTTVIMIISGILGVVLALGLFIFLPDFLAGFISKPLPNSTVWRPIFAGFLKIIILVVYMALVCLLKDIRRTFEYHGAEHKTIFCYEAGLELTIENVRKQRRFHPRCGTSFLILMLIVSIAIGLCINPIYMAITGNPANGIAFTLIKLCLLPLTMGIGYELIKFAGRHNNLFTRIISAPGMWLQRVTVKEPSDDMIECAITAFKAVVPEDQSDNI